jgi:hypothetical protein
MGAVLTSESFLFWRIGITHASQIGPDRMTCLNECVVAARTVCVQAVRHDQPNNIIYTSNITQLQLTFAAVFLVRSVDMNSTPFPLRSI